MPDTLDISKPQVVRGFIWRVSLIAGLGGILYGYDVGIIAGALNFVTNAFKLSASMDGIVVGVVPAGTMLGAIIGGPVADRIGRRSTLIWGGALFIFGSILGACAPNVATLIFARTILGVAIGFTSVTAPVYISELAPPQSRGVLIGLYQFALTIGIALADVVGYWFAAEQGWRPMFGVGAIPAVIFMMLVLTVPESPRWLFVQGRTDDAEAVLRSYTDATGTKLLLEDIRTSLLIKVERRWSALWSKAVRGSLLIAVGFVVLQQFAGINAIIYYGPRIFSLAGTTSNKSAIFDTLLVAIVNVLATVIALLLVDRVGRKPLLYVGVGGMTASLLLLAYAFHDQAALGASLGWIALVCLIGYITCFAASMGPIAWILASEVFPLRIRARGIAAVTLGYGASNTTVSVIFPSVIKILGSSMTFAIFGMFCILTLLFVRFIVPETMGRELESISRGKTSAS